MSDDMFLQTFLSESEDLLVKWEECCLKLDSEFNPNDLNALFRCVHTLKGSSKAVNLNDFGNFIHKIEDTIKALQDGKIDSAKTLSQLLDWQHVASEWIASIKSKKSFNFDQNTFDKNINFIKNSTDTDPPLMLKKLENANPVSTAPKDEMIRVQASKCDKVLRSVGQVSINISAIRRLISDGNFSLTKFTEHLNALEKHATVLHSEAISIRMQPLDRFFTRMQRLAKDVSEQTKKPVNVSIEGKFVEIDKLIVDRLIDPFVHIVRNAVDHGIENPQERKEKGKSHIGSLSLKAKNTSSGVEISVADDGQGLNPKKILSKAIEKGIVKKDSLLTEKEIIQLILKPGFSTKEQVSDLSGRGVGMDVVATTLKDLGGKLDIKSLVGKGTTFTLFIPANLTILDAFIVTSGRQKYCILIQEVDEIVDLREAGTRVTDNTELMDLRGSLVPILNLNILENSGSKAHRESIKRPALITKIEETAFAFEVDQILFKQKIMVSENYDAKKIHGFSGVAILDDFYPGMIVSLKHLANDYQIKLREHAS